MGNSEVGHLNLGAGAVVKQDLARIDDAVADGTLFENEALLAACEAARESPRGRLHLIGLVSDGGVHSGWAHLEALIELAAQRGRARPGRPRVHRRPRHAADVGARATSRSSSAGCASAGRIGTVGGRYYAMDRDRRWERTKLAYDAIVHAEGLRAASAARGDRRGLRARRDRRVHPPDRDRRLRRGGRRRRRDPLQLPPRPRPPAGRWRSPSPDFDEFERGDAPEIALTTLTQYRADWDYPVAFAPLEPATTLAEVLAERGRAPAARRRDREVRARHLLLQRRARGGVGGGGARAWSTRRATSRPTTTSREMSAAAAAEAFTERWADGDYRFGIINFANPDMVGHTGSIPAAVTAIEAVDALPRARSSPRSTSPGGACIVTADHGNAEHMLEPDGSPNTAHSLNPVPVRGHGARASSSPTAGVLADVAPDRARPARDRAAGGDDRPLADRDVGSPPCGATPRGCGSRSTRRDGAARTGRL